MATCPKCGYVRQPGDPGAADECPQCGVFHEKYRRWKAEQEGTAAAIDESTLVVEPDVPFRERLWATIWYVPGKVDQTAFTGRCVALGVLVLWGLWFVTRPWDSEEIASSFLHRPDLVFHEAGHVIFRMFGTWMMFLGGSLFQCLFPLVFAWWFLFKQGQPFSAAVCVWWCGQNFIDIAPYIGDARALALPLLGEWSDEMVDARADRHDWYNILEMIGWLDYDQVLGRLSKLVGAGLMIAACAWGGIILRLQQRNLAGDVLRE
jgi:hypothetical protein